MSVRGEGGMLTALADADRVAVSAADICAPNYRRVAGRWLLTNDVGHHVQLSDKDFLDYLEGRIEDTHPAWGELQQKGFLRKWLDFAQLVSDYRKKNSFLFTGAPLHIMVTTLRCNHKCLYCHSSVVGMDQIDKDMSVATARRAVDLVFQCPNPSVAIEFQGGEPMVNWPVIKFVTRYAKLKNEASGRGLFLALVSNFSLMDEERFQFLVQEGVSMCTSLDGPAEVHDRNRIFAGGNSHAETARWIRRFMDYTSPTGRRAHKPGALMTTTRLSLAHGDAIIDEYLRLGLPGIFIRPLSPIGFARRSWDKIGYTTSEFLAFYRRMLERIIEINRAGTPFHERLARTLLVKILCRVDPVYVDMRSPSGAALGVISYDYDGSIYTGDEARMLAQEGTRTFRVGHVSETSYNEILEHPTVRATAVATLLDNQPVCSQCAYKPYCGQDATYNLQTQSNLWGRMADNGRCELYMGIFDILFEKLQDPAARQVFMSWLDAVPGAVPA